MTVKGGKRCHVCLIRRKRIFECTYCGHNTCHLGSCDLGGMCWKCQVNPAHRTLKEVPVG